MTWVKPMKMSASRDRVLKALIVITAVAYLSFGLIANAALALHAVNVPA